MGFFRKNIFALAISLLVFVLFYFVFYLILAQIEKLESQYINTTLRLNIEKIENSLNALYKDIYIDFRKIKDEYLKSSEKKSYSYIQTSLKKGYYYSITLIKNQKIIFSYPEGKRDLLNKNALSEALSHLAFIRSNGYAVSSQFIPLPNNTLLLPIYFFIDKDNHTILEGIVKYTDLIKNRVEKIVDKKPLVVNILLPNKKELELPTDNFHQKILKPFFYEKSAKFIRHPISITGYPTSNVYIMKGEKELLRILALLIPFLFAFAAFFLLQYKNKLKIDRALNDIFYKIDYSLFEQFSLEDHLNRLSEFIGKTFKIDTVFFDINPKKKLCNTFKSPFVIENLKSYQGALPKKEKIKGQNLKTVIVFPISQDRGCYFLVFGFRRHCFCIDDFLNIGKKIADRLNLYFKVFTVSKELIESEERYRKLIEDAPLGIRIVVENKKGEKVIVYQNPKMEELTGYTLEEVVNTQGMDYIYPEDKEKAKKILNKLEKGEIPTFPADIRHIRKDGTVRIFTVFPRKTRYKGKEAFIIYAMDVTEKNEIEKKMVKNQKLELINNLLGGSVHNLNNAFTGIQGYIELLIERIETLPRERMLKYILKIKEQLKHAKEISENLLLISKKKEYKITDIELVPFIEKIISIGRVSKKGKDVEFVKIFNKTEELIAKGDRSYVNQALLNIVLNAIDAIDKKGKITISAKSLENMVEISVTDTGKGMPSQVKEHIFEPFFTTKEKGTGLGLYTVYTTIKEMGGRIEVESEEGKGTTFKVFLPKGERILHKEKEVKEKLVKDEGLVLLVDDEKIILEVGKEMLSSLGYEVVAISNPYKALEFYQKNKDKIKLAIIDVIMPGMNGVELLAKIKEIDKSAKIILSSGFAPEEVAKIIREKDLDIFLPKPYDLDTLSKVIKQVLKL